MACSISGCITSSFTKEVATKMKEIIVNAEERGRDSFGIISLSENFECKTTNVSSYKSIRSPSKYIDKIKHFDNPQVRVVINNNRAEPTTEYVEHKQTDDIQPFKQYDIVVSHNGTIANDKELIAKYSLITTTNIDAGVIAPLLHHYMTIDNLTLLEAIKRFTVEAIGSYALAIAQTNKPSVLYLVTNYKPLALWHDETIFTNTIYFSSFPEYLTNQPFSEIQEIKPYTITEITLHDGDALNVYTYSFAPLLERKALVIVSGGLDSVTVAYQLKSQGYDITLLHYNYKQQASDPELLAVNKLAKDLDCELISLDSTIFEFMPSILTTNSKINKQRTGMDGAEFAHEWVPARNLIFLSIATGIAESRGISFIALGNNLEESGAYPDNEMIFIKKLNEVLPFATQVNKFVQILQPLGNYMKHEIVKLGLELKVPYENTWSCYESGVEKDGKLYPCNQCGPCYMRRVAFEINNSIDPLLQSGFDVH